MELYPIIKSRLSLDEASQFIVRLFSDLEALKMDLDKDPDFNNALQTLHIQNENFVLAVKQIKAHAETKELERLDLVRDQKLITLRRQISVFQYSDDKNQQSAYTTATIIMKQYAGLERTNFEAETFGIKKLLEEWYKTENSYHIRALGLELHINNLKRAANNFNELFERRTGYYVQAETYDSLAFKRQMLDTYDKLANYVLSMISIKKDNDFYLRLILAFNQGRHYFSDIMAKREGRAEGEDE